MAALAGAGYPALYDGGWHPTAVCGSVGAAVAAAALLGPTRDVAAAPGRPALRGPAGRVRLRRQVAAGRPGRERRRRRRAAGGGGRARRPRAGAARGWEQAYGAPWADRAAEPAIGQNWIKAYPCCLQTHGAIDCALEPARRARRAADRPRASGLAPGGGLRRRRDAARGEVLDPLHDRVHAAARRADASRASTRSTTTCGRSGGRDRGRDRPGARRVGVPRCWPATASSRTCARRAARPQQPLSGRRAGGEGPRARRRAARRRARRRRPPGRRRPRPPQRSRSSRSSSRSLTTSKPRLQVVRQRGGAVELARVHGHALAPRAPSLGGSPTSAASRRGRGACIPGRIPK